MANIIADSASQSDVQTAVNSASNGDTVLIPNGSATWTSGITTTKQIIIRAQNYTAVSGGSSSRNVTITNNSSAPLFSMQSGDSFHVGIGGIRFNDGTSDVNYVRFTGTGSKIPLLFDCYFENSERLGSAEDVALITWLAQGGVVWNTWIDGSAFGAAPPGDAGPTIASVSIAFKSPRAWTTASTMGTLDTNGTVNVYFEDCTFVNTGGGDLDDNARIVMRYSTFDGSVWITHGFTSLWGGRHWESYNNTYTVTYDFRNHAGSYFWCRAGTGIFTDNIATNASAPVNYGNPALLKMGDNTEPEAYPQNRQPGIGHNGTTYVSDPIYIWNNTGAQSSSYYVIPEWESNIQLDRDFFIDDGAKPGYAKYTYPHPLRSEIEGENPAPPTRLRVFNINKIINARRVIS
jgi:hypothetical protein